MRRALIVTVLAIAAAAGTAAQAQGSTVNRLQGTFKDDPNASMTVGVKVNGEGTPVGSSPLRYSNVDLTCEDGTVIEISGTAPGTRFDSYTNGRALLLTGRPANPLTHFQGTVNRDGTKVAGALYAYTATFADGVTCMTGEGPGAAGAAGETDFTAGRVSLTGTSHGGGSRLLTRHLSGHLDNDPNSLISFDVFVRNGVPVRVSDVTYENLHMNCSDGTTMPLPGGVVHTNKRLIPSYRGLTFSAGTPEMQWPSLGFAGWLSKSGKHVNGEFMGFTEGLACTTGDALGPERDFFKWTAD